MHLYSLSYTLCTLSYAFVLFEFYIVYSELIFIVFIEVYIKFLIKGANHTLTMYFDVVTKALMP